MGREITLAGFQLTYEEWKALDEDARAQLLRAFATGGAGDVPADPREGYRMLERVVASGYAQLDVDPR